MYSLSSNLIKPTIPHEPPPTLAEQKRRILGCLSFPIERDFLLDPQALPPAEGKWYYFSLPTRGRFPDARSNPQHYQHRFVDD